MRICVLNSGLSIGEELPVYPMVAVRLIWWGTAVVLLLATFVMIVGIINMGWDSATCLVGLFALFVLSMLVAVLLHTRSTSLFACRLKRYKEQAAVSKLEHFLNEKLYSTGITGPEILPALTSDERELGHATICLLSAKRDTELPGEQFGGSAGVVEVDGKSREYQWSKPHELWFGPLQDRALIVIKQWVMDQLRRDRKVSVRVAINKCELVTIYNPDKDQLSSAERTIRLRLETNDGHCLEFRPAHEQGKDTDQSTLAS